MLSPGMKESMNVNMKKTISILLLAALLFCAAGNASGEAAKPDYYNAGLEVTALMGEIIDSEAYLSLLVHPETFSKIREEANTHDYGSPVAVYAVKGDPEALLKEMLLSDPESGETFNSLSPALQDQLLQRISVQTLCSVFNSRAGADYTAFSSLATVFLREDSLNAEEPCSYLYIFGKGLPILVSFGYRSAAGMFLFLPEESRKSPEAILSCLNLPGLEVTPVNTGEGSADSAGNLADYGIDPEEALRKMSECIGQELPASGRMFDSGLARPWTRFFDVTGDGCTDLCTCVTWGSGMVRTDLLVYDPLNEELYVLDGYNYDYRIERVEDGRIVIVKEGPHGYNDPVTKTYGTVKLENRQLIFEADSEVN